MSKVFIATSACIPTTVIVQAHDNNNIIIYQEWKYTWQIITLKHTLSKNFLRTNIFTHG